MVSPLHFVQPQDCTWAMWPMNSHDMDPFFSPCFATSFWAWNRVPVPMIWASTRDPIHKKTWNVLYIAHPTEKQFQQLPCAILSTQIRFYPLLPVDVLEHIEPQLVVHFHLANHLVIYSYIEILYLKRKMNDSNVATCMNYDVASSSSRSICNPKSSIRRTKGIPKNIATFGRWTPSRGRSISPKWLVYNIRFTWITPLWSSGPYVMKPIEN